MAPPSPLLDVSNVTAHLSIASVQSLHCYDGPLLCGFNVAIKGLISRICARLIVMRISCMESESDTDAVDLLQELISLLEQSRSESDKILVLKSMGNCGSKELIMSIKRVIDDKSESLVVRTQAVFALRKIAKAFDKLVSPVNALCFHTELPLL